MSLSLPVSLLQDITTGQAVFSSTMPVWLGTFGADYWPHTAPSSPLYSGRTSSGIPWLDYVQGRGAKFGERTSVTKAKSTLRLSDLIVVDLKVAAYIYGHFPRLMTGSKRHKGKVAPATVKGRVEELARFLSFLLVEVERTYHFTIERLSEITFPMLRDAVALYPPNRHLQRALKLIADPIIQKNLSSPLQWGLLDLTKSSLVFKQPEDGPGIPTLSDAQFVFLLAHCKSAITKFKTWAGLPLRDTECGALSADFGAPGELADAITSYLQPAKLHFREFKQIFGVSLTQVRSTVSDAHTSAMMIVLLMTGMRDSDRKFLYVNCVESRQGYTFLKSKHVKGQPTDAPVSEGWLAIDLTLDAYDVLSYFCKSTKNKFLFSPYAAAHASSNHGFRGGALNTKFGRWIEQIDTLGLFADWNFSVHQCRESLVFQLAKQEVGLPFISMQLKHFHSKISSVPSEVTAGYGNYRSELLSSITRRLAGAREEAFQDIYGEEARFAGGGAPTHQVRIDTFFTGLGLHGASRIAYIKGLAARGARLMPTSIGNCTKNFIAPVDSPDPACYGDYQCDPNCSSHVITERSAQALKVRKDHALASAITEPTPEFKVIWISLAERLDGHIRQFKDGF